MTTRKSDEEVARELGKIIEFGPETTEEIVPMIVAALAAAREEERERCAAALDAAPWPMCVESGDRADLIAVVRNPGKAGG